MRAPSRIERKVGDVDGVNLGPAEDNLERTQDCHDLVKEKIGDEDGRGKCVGEASKHCKQLKAGAIPACLRRFDRFVCDIIEFLNNLGTFSSIIGEVLERSEQKTQTKQTGN